MRRKDYRKPTMEIVKIQQRAHLLEESIDATRDDYGDEIVDDWE